VHDRVEVIAGSRQWPMQLFILSFVNDFPYRRVAKRDKKNRNNYSIEVFKFQNHTSEK
jgi:hypothetical protein